ncbi:nuclear protein 96-domain-containing protein [Elsinoe ampelina]|uniref:Nuclear protein 96-domain-containing protein n=1 Tax=Elsinoe ampelina TaxID=302913 RepID=A0A6A6G3U6_9PEZI|nr:nuclear protein 96-domain-containing protein [Elsinoe ampelina]
MSFGGGFGGFGSNNNQNQNQTTGFGGFGASTNNNNTGGFGSSTNTGFGANTSNTGGGLFGSGAATTSGGFGGFGSTNNNAGGFGAAKPAFGGTGTTGGGLFGSNNNTTATSGTGFGGFGATTTNNQSSGFGASTGGGLFGSTQNKPAFGGTSNTTGGGLFGGGNTNTGTSAFGQSTGGFGASTGGFGQQAQPVNQGTAAVPFSAHTEKDTATSANSHYQSITFMQPYQNFSFEELRLADYNAGRRYGNANGQAGAFGQSTGFGGFGQTNTATTTGGFGATSNTGTGLFGSGANNTSSPFGGQNQQQNTTTGGFGTGGGLFGQNKPATTGLFGSTPAASSAAPTGGLFGTSNNTQTGGGAFGGFGQTNTANSGGGLFGNNNNNSTQAKPFGGFGGTTNNTTTTGFGSTNTGGGFGQNNTQTTGTGLFGSSTTNANPFGGAQQPQQTTSAFGGFNQNQNQNQTQQNNTGTGLFGGFGQNQNQQNQQKPGGLFGSTATTGGGLFGNNNQQSQQQNTGGGLFGNNNQQSGGLFAAKPATTTTGLFGASTNNTNSTGGGLFGNNNQNQTQTSSLFGNNNNNNQSKGLFGNTTGNTGGSSLFGGLNQNNNNNAGGSLFGNTQQQQQPGNSLFGNSQQNQQQPQAQSLTASLMQNPYGNDQLFAGLGTPSQSVGPLATPLSGAQKPAKRAQAIPAFKINPSASMRLITPQKRANGYGFSYSNYGTPGSAQSFTPGRNTSLFGSGGLNRPLSKSLSTSNLRSPLGQEDSVLNPGAFTPSYRPYSSGNSIRRLKIDRSLRTDLFGTETSERSNKHVSFDASNAASNGIGGSQTNGDGAKPGPNNALVRTESDGPEPTPEELGFVRSSRSAPKESRSNGTSRPEMEQVRGNELAIVPEDEQIPASTQSAPAKQLRKDQHDQEAGEYYMIPSLQQIREMSRDQLRNVCPFIVGRTGIGKVEFSKVDLSTVELDKIMGDIVKLNVRSATVYETGVNTPPEGKGLNVPSRITLENSWPRSGGGRLPVHERKGPRYEKHVERLKRVNGTQFIDYKAETGEWTFQVQHFTTYGLDDDDDEDETMMDESEAVAPGTLTPKATTPVVATDDSAQQIDTSAMSPANSDPDDTFDFKKSGKTIPGGFGQQPLFEDEEMTAPVAHEDEISENDLGESMLEDPFNLSSGSQGLISPPETDDEENQVVGAFPEPIAPPKSILKGHTLAGTPVKERFELNDNWAEQLQRTVSPRKQDRRALREQQNLFDNGGIPTNATLGRSTNGPAFTTTMDIMNSIWNQPSNASVWGKSQAQGQKGFEWPYQNRTNGDLNTSNMNEAEQAFHASVKPNWTSDGTLVYASAGSNPALASGILVNAKKSIVAEGKDVRFAQLQAPSDTLGQPLQRQLSADSTLISTDANHIPAAKTKGSAVKFKDLASAVSGASEASTRERNVWQLASLLFDPVEDSCQDYIGGIPPSEIGRYEEQVRREAVLDFWRSITRAKAMDDIRDAPSSEHKAIACLSCGDVEGACATLVEGKNFHLATIVSQLPLDSKAKTVVKQQISTWRSQNVLSEIPPAIRAIYEIASGNPCISEGKSGAAEDKAPTFSISEQFKLDWKQAVGLRLWYGDDDINAAVQNFVTEASKGAETKQAIPTAVVNVEKESLDKHQDGLLVLLRLFGSLRNSSIAAPTAEDLFSPLAITGHPLNARPSWQLATVLLANKIISSKLASNSHLDILATSVAHQLEAISTTDSILAATTILSHLSTASLRKSAITSLLTRRASLLTTSTHPFATDPSSDTTLSYLTNCSIPASWLHSARALLSASTSDFSSQAAHLLLANDTSGAHDVLTQHVGPTAIISRDHDALRELLGHFPQDATTSIPGWKTGGAVYFDFIHLLDLTGRRGRDVEREKAQLVKRLAGALPAMAAGQGKMGLEERVAVAEMSRVVGEEARGVGEELGSEGEKRVRRLPVADDGFARQGGKLWGLYGKALRVG